MLFNSHKAITKKYNRQRILHGVFYILIDTKHNLILTINPTKAKSFDDESDQRY
jgi:hypothetical protein